MVLLVINYQTKNKSHEIPDALLSFAIYALAARLLAGTQTNTEKNFNFNKR